MVPVGGDVFEGEAKRFALGRGQRGDAEIHRLGVGAAGLQNAQGDVLGLGDLAERVLEADADHGMTDGLISALVTVPSR